MKNMEQNKIQKKKQIGNWLLFFVYLVILVYILFFSEGFRGNRDGAYRYNLIPFAEIKRYIVYRHKIGMGMVGLNLIGNVLAFVPFGFYLPQLIHKQMKFGTIFLLSMELSIVVEVIQLITRVGSCDIDDVILNTLGGCIGYLCYSICKNRRK